jgi:hypothetical protein
MEKQCRKCKKVLDVSNFNIVRTDKKGKKYYRADCKTCRGVIMPRTQSKKEIFTSAEIITLKEIVRHFKVTKVNTDKSKRTPRTFNIDIDLLDRLKTYSDIKNMSISDSINILVSMSLDLLKY